MVFVDEKSVQVPKKLICTFENLGYHNMPTQTLRMLQMNCKIKTKNDRCINFDHRIILIDGKYIISLNNSARIAIVFNRYCNVSKFLYDADILNQNNSV